jgi:hypothetical protein
VLIVLLGTAVLAAVSGTVTAQATTVHSGNGQVVKAYSPAKVGYDLVGSDGGVFAFGDAKFFGSMAGMPLNKPVIGMAATPDGKGYWLVAADGGVFAFGDATFFGSTANSSEQDIVAMAATPDGEGYWLVSNNGPAGPGHAAVYAFGDAHYYGTAPFPLNKPIVGIASIPDGKGYWLVASDGGVFAFGDAPFKGSIGGVEGYLQPVVGIAFNNPTSTYWIAHADGHIEAFETNTLPGEPQIAPNAPIVGISTTNDGVGLRLVASDGGVFCTGNAAFEGSMGGTRLNAPVVGMASMG